MWNNHSGEGRVAQVSILRPGKVPISCSLFQILLQIITLAWRTIKSRVAGVVPGPIDQLLARFIPQIAVDTPPGCDSPLIRLFKRLTD